LIETNREDKIRAGMPMRIQNTINKHPGQQGKKTKNLSHYPILPTKTEMGNKKISHRRKQLKEKRKNPVTRSRGRPHGKNEIFGKEKKKNWGDQSTQALGKGGGEKQLFQKHPREKKTKGVGVPVLGLGEKNLSLCADTKGESRDRPGRQSPYFGKNNTSKECAPREEICKPVQKWDQLRCHGSHHTRRRIETPGGQLASGKERTKEKQCGHLR